MTRRLLPRALAVIALVAGLVAVGLGPSGDSDGYVVRAEFRDAAGIRKNSQVKIGGVPVGRVTGLDLSRDDTAVAVLELDRSKGGAPIGAGATAKARPVNLLGEKYVDLSAGDLRRPQPSGTLIPAARTSGPVEIDDVLNVLDPDSRAALRIMLNETGIALAGRGADFNATLEKLPPALDDARAFLAEIDSQRQAMRELITRGDRVMVALDRRRDGLGHFVNNAEGAMRTLASRPSQLRSTVASAPGALRQLRSTLTRLGDASQQLEPAAADLQQVAAPLRSLLVQLPGAQRDARGTFRTARAVAPALARLGEQGTPVVRRLRGTTTQLAAFADALAPVTEMLDDDGMRRFLRFADGWSKLTAVRDSLGHIFRVRHTADRDYFAQAVDRMLAGSGGSKAAPPTTPGADARPPRAPGLGDPSPPSAPELPAAGQQVSATQLPSSPRPRTGSADALRLFDYLLGS